MDSTTDVKLDENFLSNLENRDTEKSYVKVKRKRDELPLDAFGKVLINQNFSQFFKIKK